MNQARSYEEREMMKRGVLIGATPLTGGVVGCWRVPSLRREQQNAAYFLLADYFLQKA